MKISILIPSYNSEKFIYRCVNSVMNQTYKVNEIIIVDDGSTDNSLKILKDFEKKDNRIKIISQENKGLSKTRNILIDNSIGDYFYFIDSDDWIENDCIENFLIELKKDQYDLIFAKSFTNNKINKYASRINENTTKEEYAIFNCTYVWNIFISKDFWKRNKLRFYDEYPFFEDIGIFSYLISKSEKTGFVLKPTYHYIVNKKSTSRGSISEYKIIALYNQIQHLYNLVNSEYKNGYPQYINDNIAFSLSIFVNYIVFMSVNLNKIKYLKMTKKLEKDNGRIKYPKCFWKKMFFLLYRIFIW